MRDDLWRDEHEVGMQVSSRYRLRVREVEALEKKAAAERRLAHVAEQKLALESPEFAAELEARKPKPPRVVRRMTVEIEGEELVVDSFSPSGIHRLPPGVRFVREGG